MMFTKPKISLIVAFAKNGVIGRDGRIPWHLPDDMRWFREQTMGKPVIMGRKTYESIPERYRPLPGRHNIIVTRNRLYLAKGATIVQTIEAALKVAGDAVEVIVIGGAELYRQFLPQANRLYLTLIGAEFEGDTYFPTIDPADWYLSSRQEHPADEKHAYPFSWLILERVPN